MSNIKEFVAPSWSWARQPQRRVFCSAVVEAYRIRPTDPELYCDASLVGYGAVTANVNRFGAIESAYLIVKAYYCDVEMSVVNSDRTHRLRVAITGANISGIDPPRTVFDTETVESVAMVTPSGNTVQTLQRSNLSKQEPCSGTVRLLWLLPKTCLVLAFSSREEGAFERLGLYEDTAGPRVPARLRMRVPETFGGGLKYGETRLI